jgi:hypothetical protein
LTVQQIALIADSGEAEDQKQEGTEPAMRGQMNTPVK